MKNLLTFAMCVLFSLVVFSSIGNAQLAVLNTKNDVSIGGEVFRAGDFFSYDFSTGNVELFYSEDNFSPSGSNNADTIEINPDAISIRDDGTFMFSSRTHFFVNETKFDQRAIIDFNPFTRVATKEFEQLGVDISGVDLLDNGNYLIAAKQSGRVIGGLEYNIGDVFEYDPVVGTSELFFSAENFLTEEEGGVYSAPANIDALELLENGNLLFSTTNSAQVETADGDGTRVFQANVYEYNFDTLETTLFFDGFNLFDGVTSDLKSFSLLPASAALAVPEPASISFGILTAFAITLRRRRSCV